MKRLVSALTLLLVSASAVASGGPLYHFKPDAGNTASVQRGANNFMNYCSGCHSLAYQRYSRLAADNDIPDNLLGNIMFTSDKPGDHIVSAMSPEDATQWFGGVPPDLSLVARARGPAWIYSFLKSFYVDDSKVTGVNNLQLPGASMPHVLGGLQGYQALPHEEHAAGGHNAKPKFDRVSEGTLDAKAYDALVGDLVNFLAYVGEPGKAQMHSRGVKVLLYLLLILIPVTYMIKREFWKDVH
jgi:ubiquinol-cytochrome c reductase cytochrome c1 subunit